MGVVGEGKERVGGHVLAKVVAVAEEVDQRGNAERNHNAQPGRAQVGQAPAPLARDDHNADQGDQPRIEHHAEPENPLAVALGQGDGVVAWLAGANRDQGFVLGQPAQGVEGQVAVALDAEVLVGGKVRIPKDHQAAPRLGVSDGDGQGHRPGLIDALVELDRLIALAGEHAQVGLGPTGLRCLD